MVTPINAVLSAGPDDTVCPTFWLGGTVNARGRLLLDNGDYVQGSGVTFLARWVPDRTVQILLTGEWDADAGIWRCAFQFGAAGPWEVRLQCLAPLKQTDWLQIIVAASPGKGNAPAGSLWFGQTDNALVTGNGAGLSGVRIGELLQVTDGAGVTMPGTRTSDGADVAIPFSVITAGAQGAIAGQVAAVNAGVIAVDNDAQAVETSRAQVALDAIATGADRIITGGDRAASEAARDLAVPAAATATGKAGEALVSASTASLAAAAASAGSILYATTAAGVAATAEGQAFGVQSTGASFADYYRKTGGAAAYFASLPSKAAYDAIPAISVAGSDGWNLHDDDGRIGGHLAPDGREFTTAGFSLYWLPDGRAQMRDSTGRVLFESRQGAGLTLAGEEIFEADLGGFVRAYLDPDGRVGAGLRPNGTIVAYDIETVVRLLRPADLAGVTFETINISGVGFVITDPDGRIGFQVAEAGGSSGGGGSVTGDYTLSQVQALSAEGTAYSDRVRRRDVSGLIQPVYNRNLVISYGQSLSVGRECWPALTRNAARYDNLMVGLSENPLNGSLPTWLPVGGSAVWTPLRGETLDVNTNRAVLDDATVALLTAGAQNEAESPLIGTLSQFRSAWLLHRGLASDPSAQMVAMAAGVSGTSITALSPGAVPESFNRWREAVTTARNLAVASGQTFAVTGITFNQGEGDYGDSTSFADYVAKLTALIAAMRSFVVGINPPSSGTVPVYLHQTGGTWANDTLELAIARAQSEVARTVPGVFVATGNQPYPDKLANGGHFTANGSRWAGNQVGKVMARTLIDGEGWECTHALRWTTLGTTLLGLFHAPVPPIRFAAPWDGLSPAAAASLPNRGVYVVDGGGELALSNGRVVAGNVIAFDLSRALQGDAKVWLGRKAIFNGAVCIADSDTTPLADSQVYTAGSGQYPAENNPDLIGYRNAAANFALADVLPITSL